MTKQTATISITLDLTVANEVTKATVHRLVTKAIDNGIAGGFDASLGVTSAGQQVDIQLGEPEVCGFELPDGSTAHYRI